MPLVLLLLVPRFAKYCIKGGVCLFIEAWWASEKVVLAVSDRASNRYRKEKATRAVQREWERERERERELGVEG